jgi:ATP-binding cassette subfamily F protein uup
VGGYSDWLRQRPAAPSPTKVGEGRGEVARKPPTKLSYKETRELEQLPVQIESLEAEQKTLTGAMSSGDYHKRGGEQMRRDATRAQEIEQQLEAAFERWAELDAKRSNTAAAR